MKLMTILAASLLAFSTAGFAQNDQAMKFQEEQLTLTQEWDKTFPQSDKVNHLRHHACRFVPGASHTDLYDNLEKIPFGKIVEFYNQYLCVY